MRMKIAASTERTVSSCSDSSGVSGRGWLATASAGTAVSQKYTLYEAHKDVCDTLDISHACSPPREGCSCRPGSASGTVTGRSWPAPHFDIQPGRCCICRDVDGVPAAIPRPCERVVGGHCTFSAAMSSGSGQRLVHVRQQRRQRMVGAAIVHHCDRGAADALRETRRHPAPAGVRSALLPPEMTVEDEHKRAVGARPAPHPRAGLGLALERH